LFYKKNLFIFIPLLILLSSCAQKEPNTPKNCGDNTMLEAAGVGAVVGGIAAKVTRHSGIVGAVIGGVVGAIAGQQLSNMQCDYAGQEQILLNKINMAIEKNAYLVNQTNTLNQQMFTLYSQINTIQTNQESNLRKKSYLINEINKKKKEVLGIKTLNSTVMLKVRQYNTLLNSAKYSKLDKQRVQNTLQKITISLQAIKRASIYNLNQLNQFEKRVQRV